MQRERDDERGPSRRPGSPRPGDPLAAELLDVLFGEVRAVTARLQALLRGEPVAPIDAAELNEAGDAAERIGWQLAVLFSAGGADVLSARRERAGLGPFLELVQRALARIDRRLELPAGLPALGTVGRGWEAPWLIGAVLFEAGRRLAPGARVPWSLEPAGPEARAHRLVVSAPPDRGLDNRIEELARLVPGTKIGGNDERRVLALPEPWLVG